MPFVSQKSPVELSSEQREELQAIALSRSEQVQRVERARILLDYADGQTVSAIARKLRANRAKVNRCIDKALQLGVRAALGDLPGRGKKPHITREAKVWLVSLACGKPRELGYAQELWTMRLLAQHAREHCEQAGHPSLHHLVRGTVSKILSQAALKPHKLRYYVERRDRDFETRMAQVLYIYKEVELLRQAGQKQAQMVAILSSDEKPGIQAIESRGAERPAVKGKYSSWQRDCEYVRHGRLRLLAGIDLLDGHVHGLVADRHRSREFVQFLKRVDDYYPQDTHIRLILDNHSAHLSKEIRAFLATRPNRFEFVFTPMHGSWLNLVESFFTKMAKILLRELRVSSKTELKERLEKYLEELNQSPVIFRWQYGLDTLSVV